MKNPSSMPQPRKSEEEWTYGRDGLCEFGSDSTIQPRESIRLHDLAHAIERGAVGPPFDLAGLHARLDRQIWSPHVSLRFESRDGWTYKGR